MRTWHKIALLIGLWAAFWFFGLWVRSQMSVPLDVARDTEIYSFDFQGYAKTFTDYRAIPYGRFRHPLWGWLTAPVTLFGQGVIERLGERAFWVYLVGFVVRWGLTECQLYGGHWMYVLPLLLGLGFRHLPR